MKNPVIDLDRNLAVIAFLLGCLVSPPCRAQANLGQNLGPEAAVEATGHEDCARPGGLYTGTINICGWVALVSGNSATLPGEAELYVDGIVYRGLIGGLIEGVSRPDVQDYFAAQGIAAPGNLGYSSTWDSTTVVDGVHRLSITVEFHRGDYQLIRREVFSVVVVTRNNVGRSRTSSTVGVYRNGTFGITYGLSPGTPDVAIPFGVPGDIPLAGDWYGSGSTGIGLFREGVFYLRASLSEGPPDWVIPFGNPGDLPVVGDWNGDGISKIGVYSNGTFFLRMSLAPDAQVMSIPYGAPGDIPVAGDWTGDGISKIGVYRQGVFLLRKSLTSGIADLEIAYGISGDIPVVGDWLGNGATTIGIYRDATFHLRTSLTSGVADLQINYGAQGDIPVVGNWSPQWMPINNGLELDTSGSNVSALAIDPAQTSTLYAASNAIVGYTVSNDHPMGVVITPVLMSTVFKSTDSGTHWIPAATFQNDWIKKLFAQRNPSTLYFNAARYNPSAATIFKSTDGASTWEPLTLSDGSLLGVDPADSSTLYADKQGNSWIYKSTDGGATWTQIGSVKGAASRASVLAIDPQNSNVLYVAASEWRSVQGWAYQFPLGVFKSVDGGFHWISVNSNFTPSFLAIDPHHSETLYALAETIYRSTDGGTTWTAVNNGLPAPPSQSVSPTKGAQLVIDPQNTEVLYLGLRSGAVFRTLDGGNSWTPINAGLSGCPVDTLAIDPQNPARLYKACHEGIYTISLTH